MHKDSHKHTRLPATMERGGKRRGLPDKVRRVSLVSSATCNGARSTRRTMSSMGAVEGSTGPARQWCTCVRPFCVG